MNKLTRKDKDNIILILDYGIRFGFYAEMDNEKQKEYLSALKSARKLYQNYGYGTELIDRELKYAKKNSRLPTTKITG